MKNTFKIAAGALALTAATAFAGQYPFPQNMKHPHGTTIEYADTKVVKAHYEAWKKAWYDASQGWVLAPEGTCSTVSEAIAYGMLITVYMDEEDVFKKLYNTWKTNGGNGAGMNWRIGCEGGTGSATDADEDAALALVMASKQWNNTSYLSDAKTLIGWIAKNDIDGNNSLKPGNQWTAALNPSYVMLGHYYLFEKVTGDSKWSTIRQKAAKDLLACQDAATGLVGDWCDWNSHKPVLTGAAVSNDIGYYDDASRTPWRTAWAYYWYGDADSKKFNETIAKWLIPTTHTASGVNSGYKWTGNGYEADLSKKRNFVSSSFSGGLGLATSSIGTEAGNTYLGTTYKTLTSLKSCEKAQGCGEGSVTGEKYYPATLNVLYLLLMTGNMPNLYDLTGFTPFTPDPTKAPSVSDIEGQQMASRDSTVGLSGFWNWGAYHDKLGIGTKMVPDSGSSPLYLKDGAIYAEASMEIGPEPEWSQEKADAGLLKYPSAGIAMSFLSNDKKGVDFTKLEIKSLRVTMKASGPIRMAILNEKTAEAGAEPGIYVPATGDYVTTTYDLTACDMGFLGRAKNCMSPDPDSLINILSWVDQQKAPEGSEILKAVTGLKWEVKDAKGGIGELSIKSIEFLDASGNVVDPEKITGIKISDTPKTGIQAVAAPAAAKITVAGMNISVEGAKAGSNIAVFNMQGKLVASGKAIFGNAAVSVPSKGLYMVRVGNKLSKVSVK